jgi:hypothetical protein
MNESWWKQHGKAVKRQLTVAEGKLNSEPRRSLSMAEEVFTVMDEHGYPDWWHRVERLKTDALFAVQREEW